MSILQWLFGKKVELSDFPVYMQVLYTELNDLTYPLMFCVCLPRGIDTTDVYTLFDASCPRCNAKFESKTIMQIGDLLQTGAITITPAPKCCPECGMESVLIRFNEFSESEKEALLADKFFSHLSWFS